MTLSKTLKRAIRRSGKTVSSIARESGVAQPLIFRFMQGRDLRLQTADKLAKYFDEIEINLTKAKK